MDVQNGEAARIERRPFVADIDANVVARRNIPAELTIDIVVMGQIGKHRHRWGG
jgi:hypothetical protein